MPRIINIVPKDIYFMIELRLDEFKKIKMALDGCTMASDTPEGKDAVMYVSKDFYNFVCDSIEEVEGKEEDDT